MDRYCRILINSFTHGIGMQHACTMPGMPSMTEVRRWLFNREYHHEYAGFREHFLYAMNQTPLVSINEIEYRREKFNKALEEESPDAPKLKKQFYDYLTAAQWQFKSIALLEKLYAAHEKGEDFLIEGEHFYKILEPLPEPVPLTEEEKQERAALREERKAERQKALKEGDYMAFANSIPTSTSKTLLRAEAEKIIGSPLLYGRYQRRKRAKERRGNTNMVRVNLQSKQEIHSVPLEREQHKINAEKVSLHTKPAIQKTIPTNAGIPPSQNILRNQFLNQIQSSRDKGQGAGDNNSPLANKSEIRHPTSAIQMNRFQRREIGKVSPRTGGSNYTKPKKRRKRR